MREGADYGGNTTSGKMRGHLSTGLAKVSEQGREGGSLDRGDSRNKGPVVRADKHVQQKPEASVATQTRSGERGSDQMILNRRLLSSSVIIVDLAILFPIFSCFHLSCISVTQHTDIQDCLKTL